MREFSGPVSQGSPQFTPRQLLDAGRRAEAEGKLDHANQLYRHLTDHYGYTAEAVEARSGLGRLGAGPAQRLSAENGAAAPAPWPPLLAQDRAPGTNSSVGGRPVPSERNYRTGRVLATLVTWVGWLIAAAGAAVVPLVLAADPQMLLRDFPYAMSLGPIRCSCGGGCLCDCRTGDRVLGPDGARAVRPGQCHTRVGRPGAGATGRRSRLIG